MSQVLHFLKMWLTKHIMSEDMEYAPFFLGKGAVASTHTDSKAKGLWHFMTGS